MKIQVKQIEESYTIDSLAAFNPFFIEASDQDKAELTDAENRKWQRQQPFGMIENEDQLMDLELDLE